MITFKTNKRIVKIQEIQNQIKTNKVKINQVKNPKTLVIIRIKVKRRIINLLLINAEATNEIIFHSIAEDEIILNLIFIQLLLPILNYEQKFIAL